MRFWHTNKHCGATRGIALLEAAVGAVLLVILFCGGLAVSDFLYKSAGLSEIVDQHIYDTGARVFHTRTQFNRVVIELDQTKLTTILNERVSAIENETLRSILKVNSAAELSNGEIAATLYRIEGVAAVVDFDRADGSAKNISLLSHHSVGNYDPPPEQLVRTELRAAISGFVDLYRPGPSALAIPTGAWGNSNSGERYLSQAALIAVRAFVALDNSPGGWFWRYFQGSKGISAIKMVPFRGDLDT